MPIQKLHGDERRTVLLADLVDVQILGWFERRRRLRLTSKSFQGLGLLLTSSGRNLRATKRCRRGVFGLVDDAHTRRRPSFQQCGSER